MCTSHSRTGAEVNQVSPKSRSSGALKRTAGWGGLRASTASAVESANDPYSSEETQRPEGSVEKWDTSWPMVDSNCMDQLFLDGARPVGWRDNSLDHRSLGYWAQLASALADLSTKGLDN